jgi:hypothetical protein
MASSGPSWEELVELAESWKPPEGPVVLSEEHLRLIDRVERTVASRPRDDASRDVTWVERVLDEWRYVVRNVRKVPRG